MVGTRRLFANALRPTRSQFREDATSWGSSTSESSGKESSILFCPPIKCRSFVTKSSTSKAPDPDFIARAFWAPKFEAINSRCESSVASCGPLTDNFYEKEDKCRVGEHLYPCQTVYLLCGLEKAVLQLWNHWDCLGVLRKDVWSWSDIQIKFVSTFDFLCQWTVVLAYVAFLLRVLVRIEDHICIVLNSAFARWSKHARVNHLLKDPFHSLTLWIERYEERMNQRDVWVSYNLWLRHD